MQNIDLATNDKKAAIKLTQITLGIALCLMLWLSPITNTLCQHIDVQIFKFLNNSLANRSVWQLFWGLLNHQNESWLNVCVMIAINLLCIYSQPSSKRVTMLIEIIYFWFFFQLVLFLTHMIFSDILHIQRLSPSFVQPAVLLHEVLNIPAIKVYSNTCFPAGHALVAIFWANFSIQYATRTQKTLIIVTAVLITLPRLFSGAHWASDVIFTTLYALLWVNIAKFPSIFKVATTSLHKIFKVIGISPAKSGQSL